MPLEHTPASAPIDGGTPEIRVVLNWVDERRRQFRTSSLQEG